MSTSTLTRPTVQTPAPVRTRSAVGSYVDTDGVRRAPRVVGSYTGTSTPGAPAPVGSYTGRPSAAGSYVRSER